MNFIQAYKTIILDADNYMVAAAGWQITLHLNTFTSPRCYVLSGALVHWNGADSLVHPTLKKAYKSMKITISTEEA